MTGKTTSGFEYEIDGESLDDYEPFGRFVRVG